MPEPRIGLRIILTQRRRENHNSEYVVHSINTGGSGVGSTVDEAIEKLLRWLSHSASLAHEYHATDCLAQPLGVEAHCRFAEGRDYPIDPAPFLAISPWFTGVEARIWEPKDERL